MAADDPRLADDAQRPLLDARDDDEVANNDRTAPATSTFKPTLGAAAAYGMIISIVIGSGVFTSSGSIDTNVPSPGIALVIWLIGGILAWSGATTMAELGTAIPGEGGVQPYLQYIYGDIWGFLAAWTWIVAVMPATLAILSTVFVESIYSARGVTDEAGTAVHKILSIVILVVVSALNGVSTAVSTQLSGFFVGTKFVSIVLIVIAALVVIGVQASNPERHDFGGHDWYVRPWFSNRKIRNSDGTVTDWDKISSWELLGHISAAVYGALWAYSGWDKVQTPASLSACPWQLTSFFD
jgi:solute carrier family 7 (L-type amino acid transporter), member 9/15